MPASVVARISSDVRRGLGGGERFVLAVSGGIDSMVLLDAAAEAARDRIVVATFDHGTGPEATRAARLVSRRAADLRVRCECGVSAAVGASEAELRVARWRFLNDVAATGGGRVVTAHTADDQIETVLMRTLRGAGARGLAGLAARGPVLRPLLDVRRSDVEAYAQARGIEWAEDPSNSSMRYFRNRVRHQLLPALRSVAPAIDDDLLCIGSRAAAWRDEVEAFVDDRFDIHLLASEAGLDVDATALAGCSIAELRVFLPAMLARAGAVLDRRGIIRLAEFARQSRVGARAQLSGAWEVIRSRTDLQLRVPRAVRPTPTTLAVSQPTTWGGWVFSPTAAGRVDTVWGAWIPTDRPVMVRAWRAGDAMVAGAGTRPRKVKDLLSRAGITGYDRMNWPVVVAGEEILWIPGVRRSENSADSTGQPGLSFVCEYLNR
jgi:tRNA(Ile)-lysidine synthase